MELTYYIFLVYVTTVMGNPCFNQTLNAMPYPYNCNTFIVCWMSRPYFQACPIGSLFDTITYNCQPWPIAICCNPANPTLWRHLPPLSPQPGGIIGRRILPPISNNLITKLLKDNITTQLTTLNVQQAITEQQLLTKLTTITESSPFNEITTTTIKEPTLSTRSSLAAKTIPTLSVTTSLPQEDLSKNTIKEESTTKQASLESLPTVPISFTKASELTTFTTDSTRTKPQISIENISTKETTFTDVATTKIESEIPITPSESTIIFTKTTTKLTSLSDTLQPIKITTLIHDSEPTTILPQSSSTLLKTIGTTVIETTKMTSEPKFIITEPEITHITNIVTLKPLSSITDTIKSQTNKENIDYSNASTIIAPSITTTQDVSGTISKTNAITPVLSTKFTKAPLTTVPKKNTTPDSETANMTHSTTIDINTVATELNGKTEPSITETPSLSNTTIDNLYSTMTSIVFRNTNDQNAITFTLPTYITDVSPSDTAKNILVKATEINSKITESVPESSLDSMDSGTTFLSISTSSNGLTPIPYTLLPTKSSESDIHSTGTNQNLITNLGTLTTSNRLVTKSKTMLPLTTSTSIPGSTQLSEQKLITAMATNDVGVTTSEQNIQLTTYKITSDTEINSTQSEPNTIKGTMATITASKATIPPIIPTSALNATTITTSRASEISATSKITSITEINSTRSEPITRTGTLTSVLACKRTLPPIIPTSFSTGATVIASETSSEATTPKVISRTEIISTGSGPHIATDTMATFTESQRTLPPVILTSASNGVTVITSEISVEATTSKVTSINKINSIGSEPDINTSTMATSTASITTVPRIISTSASNEATATTNETSEISLASKGTSITEINSTGSEPNTVTGTMATITASKATLPQIITTSNGATAITSETSVVSTTPKFTSITEINLTGNEPVTTTDTLTSTLESKRTLPPIIPTSSSNRGTAIISQTSEISPTSKVTSINEINSKVTEPDISTSTMATRTASTASVSRIIPSSALNESTSITSETSTEATTPKVISITEIQSIGSETNTVLSTVATITASKATLPPIIRTSATESTSSVNSNTSVEATTLKSINSSENLIITEPSRVVTEYALRPDEIKTTLFYLPPTITTFTTEEPCSVCSTHQSNEYPEATVAKADSATEANEKYSESTTSSSIATSKDINPSTLINTNMQTLSPAVISSDSSTNIETISPISTTTTYPIITSLTSRVHLSPVTLEVTGLSAMTDNYPTVSVTKRLLPPITMLTENLDIQSSTSREPTITTSVESGETTEIYTSRTERNPVSIDLNTPIRVSPSTSTKILTSGQSLPPSSVVIISHTKDPDVVSTNRPLPPLTPTTSINASDSIQNKGIMKQENTSLYTKRTLPPIPITHDRPCPYYTSSTTSEAPLEPQLPECGINDDFVYPELVNCNYYFNCFNGIMQRLNCRPNFGFNPHIMKCVPVESAKCGKYKSAADQRSYLISFMLLNELTKKTQLELTKDEIAN